MSSLPFLMGNDRGSIVWNSSGLSGDDVFIFNPEGVAEDVLNEMGWFAMRLFPLTVNTFMSDVMLLFTLSRLLLSICNAALSILLNMSFSPVPKTLTVMPDVVAVISSSWLGCKLCGVIVKLSSRLVGLSNKLVATVKMP